MKKIVLMLLGVAATINVMAIDYTAKAKVTLQATSGYSCNLMLSEYAEAGALNGSVMNMEDRKVALYALNGTTKLQIAKGVSLDGVKLGLLADASTSYTITVSAVEGTETLYIWDADSASYALTAGASYTFAAAANATDEARFVIMKAPLPSAQAICFNYNVLSLTKYKGAKVEVYAKEAATPAVTETVAVDTQFDIDLSAEAAGRYIVKIDLDGDDTTTTDKEEYQIDVKPAVTDL